MIEEKFIPQIPVLDFSDGTEMLCDFTSEALHLLIDAENSFYAAENNPTDKESIDNLFKIFHTIRGMAGFLNLKNIESLSSKTEIMLDMIRKERLKFEKHISAVTMRCVNDLRRLLILLNEQIENRGKLKSPYYDASSLFDDLQRTIAGEIPLIKTSEISLQRQFVTGEVQGGNDSGKEDERQKVLLKKQEVLIQERDQAIRLKQQAEKIARQKTDFLANMSHEIRTLMNSILGFSKLLSESDLNKKQKDQLNTIVSSGQLLLDIVNDILDFSRSEMGKLKLEQIPFNLREAIRDVIQIVRLQLGNKPVILGAHVDVDVPNVLIGDPTRLKQIFINLLSNAVRFTDEGKITALISLEKTQEQKPQEATLRFTVKDTGRGIPQEKIDDIFDPYTQAEDSTARLYGGSGLGLAICKSYVEAMRGRIWAESKLNKGSQFIFVINFRISEIPVGQRESSQAPSRDQLSRDRIEQISCAGIKVLVVDDSIPSLELMEAYFESLQCMGDYVKNGKEAIEKIKENQYDICFMDLQMPDMDGVEATKIIRREINSSIPIIALTAADRQDELDQCLKVGMDGYLTKPFEMLDLKSRIIQYSNYFKEDKGRQ